MHILGDTSSDKYPWVTYICAKIDVPADVAQENMEYALLKNEISCVWNCPLFGWFGWDFYSKLALSFIP